MQSSDVGLDEASERDRGLISRVARGSTAALGDLYDRHAATVFGMARRILGQTEDAEEVVQDVFAQVWRQAARYEESRASVAGWIVMLARTRAIDRLRRRRSRPDERAPVDPASTPEMIAGGGSPEETMMSTRDARDVQQALVTLPDEQRSLIMLAYYEGLTHSEIAARTSVPLGTVKTRLRTAMTKLRSALRP